MLKTEHFAGIADLLSHPVHAVRGSLCDQRQFFFSSKGFGQGSDKFLGKLDEKWKLLFWRQAEKKAQKYDLSCFCTNKGTLCSVVRAALLEQANSPCFTTVLWHLIVMLDSFSGKRKTFLSGFWPKGRLLMNLARKITE